MIDISHLDEENIQFQEMGIFELRELARAVGVHLPTTLRKSELITEIKAVISGQKQRFIPLHKKGRPPKGYTNRTAPNNISFTDKSVTCTQNDRIYDYTIWGKYEGQCKAQPTDSTYMLCENDNAELTDNYYGMHELVQGIVHIDSQGNGRLHTGAIHEIGTRRIAKVGLSCIQKYNLRCGDYIEGVIGISKRDECLTLFRVYSICGEPVGTPRMQYQQQPQLPVDTQIIFDDPALMFTRYLCPIGKGQRVLISANDDISQHNILQKFAQHLAQSMHVYYIIMDSATTTTATNDNIEYIPCLFNSPRHQQLYILELVLDNAKRMLELGKDVAIIIENIDSVYQMYQQYYSKYYQAKYDIDEHADLQLRTDISTGRNTQYGSITLFAGVSNPNNSLSHYISLTRRAYNSMISIKSFSDYTPIILDINNTFTLNADAMLKQDYPKSMQLRAECIDQSASTINQLIQQYNNKG